MIVSKIERFLFSVYNSIRFLGKMLREKMLLGNYYFRYSDCLKGKTVVILANGPSLTSDIENIKKRSENPNALLYAVNDCVMTDMFLLMRPQLYCFIDRLYFDEQAKEYRIYDYLNERVQWDIQLFIPIKKKNFVTERIHNKHITIVPIPTLLFSGFENCKYPAYKRGIAVPLFVNVVILAIYTSLNMGVKRLYLYGVDHTFLKLVFVDDNNELCLKDDHYYGSKVIHIAPREDGSHFNVAGFVYDQYLTFKEHDSIRGYADYLGAEIINCTKCSCIDSYVRQSQIEDK